MIRNSQIWSKPGRIEPDTMTNQIQLSNQLLNKHMVEI